MAGNEKLAGSSVGLCLVLLCLLLPRRVQVLLVMELLGLVGVIAWLFWSSVVVDGL